MAQKDPLKINYQKGKNENKRIKEMHAANATIRKTSGDHNRAPKFNFKSI